jgi:hypothetical protein
LLGRNLSIKPLGFPVSPLFAEAASAPLEAPDDDEPIKIIPCQYCPGN